MSLYAILVYFFLFFSLAVEILTEYFNWRKMPESLPPELSGLMGEEEYRKNKSYNNERARFSVLISIVSTIVLVLFISLRGFPILDDFIRSFGYGEIFTGLLFYGAILAIMTLLQLPASIYSTFFLEARYGLNRTTVKTFVLDKIKGILLTVLLGGPLAAAALWFFGAFPADGWLYAWGFFSVVSFTFGYLAPVLFLPLFNKFEPLKNDELVRDISLYAEKEKFRLKGIFTMDGSRRSTRLNAFFTGFGNLKRIVLYDTLVEKLSPQEILSVLAHEMGHYKKKHVIIHQIQSLIASFLMFFILSIFIKDPELFAVFSMDHISVYAGILFFSFLYSPMELVLSVAGNYLSRVHEYQADRYAAETTGTSEYLISALKKLSVNNLSRLVPSSLDVFFHYSHPPLFSRINALGR